MLPHTWWLTVLFFLPLLLLLLLFLLLLLLLLLLLGRRTTLPVGIVVWAPTPLGLLRRKLLRRLMLLWHTTWFSRIKAIGVRAVSSWLRGPETWWILTSWRAILHRPLPWARWALLLIGVRRSIAGWALLLRWKALRVPRRRVVAIMLLLLWVVGESPIRLSRWILPLRVHISRRHCSCRAGASRQRVRSLVVGAGLKHGTQRVSSLSPQIGTCCRDLLPSALGTFHHAFLCGFNRLFGTISKTQDSLPS
mmetsp:Transcript_22309/g.52496  ORF Transcript_22309/g.52496 Transcript_22309/m.52496 type:complete len:250 (-) Transcript_22309:1533-2282(-)